jgi:hypothetical protein
LPKVATRMIRPQINHCPGLNTNSSRVRMPVRAKKTGRS